MKQSENHNYCEENNYANYHDKGWYADLLQRLG